MKLASLADERRSVASALLIGLFSINSALAQEPKPPADIPTSWQGFLASRDPEDQRLVAAIKNMDWWKACTEWGRERHQRKDSRRAAALREFLLSDDTINGTDLMNVADKKVAVGMTACGVYASLGMPNKINYARTASSLTAQIIYRDRNMYIYTEAASGNHNGIVRSIQQY